MQGRFPAGERARDGDPARSPHRRRLSAALRTLLRPARSGLTLGGRDTLAPRLARAVTTSVLAGYAAVTLLNVHQSGVQGAALIACSAAVLALYALQFQLSSPRARRWSGRRQLLTLAGQAALTFAPMAVWGTLWGSMAATLGGSVLLVLPARTAWPVFGVIQAVVPGMAYAEGRNPGEIGYLTVAGTLTGLVIYGLTRLTDLVDEVHSTRAAMARMAVTQERLRFARDLHDLLGYGLSAITLKSELIQRLITSHPARAREEVAALLGVSRQALADVRLVASGYRDMSLQVEAESVREVMRAADVEAEVDVCCGRLHPLVDTVLATSLREGVTNILRHSKVQSCTIKAELGRDTVRLVLENDGVVTEQGSATVDGHSGSGLGNLRTRLSAIGGRLTAQALPGGRFRLEAEAPSRPAAGSPADSAAVGSSM